MDEVREMRRKISAEFGNDLNQLVAYYQELYQITLNRRGGSLCPPLPSAMKTMQFSLIWY